MAGGMRKVREHIYVFMCECETSKEKLAFSLNLWQESLNMTQIGKSNNTLYIII